MKIKDLIKKITDNIILYSILEEDGYWTVYLLNVGDVEVKDIFILSYSHGFIGNKEKHSSILRHYYERVLPTEKILIESLVETSQLSNMFDVSLYLDKDVYENTYIFDMKNLADRTVIPIINIEGHILSTKE